MKPFTRALASCSTPLLAVGVFYVSFLLPPALGSLRFVSALAFAMLIAISGVFVAFSSVLPREGQGTALSLCACLGALLNALVLGAALSVPIASLKAGRLATPEPLRSALIEFGGVLAQSSYRAAVLVLLAWCSLAVLSLTGSILGARCVSTCRRYLRPAVAGRWLAATVVLLAAGHRYLASPARIAGGVLAVILLCALGALTLVAVGSSGAWLWRIVTGIRTKPPRPA